MQAQTEDYRRSASIDPEDVARFSRIADAWWDPAGKFKPLHEMNPVRIHYVRDRVSQHYHRAAEDPAPLSGLQLLDIGCGGGLIAEPMARLGASVTAIDASAVNIATAAHHAVQNGLHIDYRASSAEALAATGIQYDVVLALEIIEHAASVESFLAAASALVKPGGILILSTLNRTAESYALAILGAEYLLRLLPRGTHQWSKFLRPSELARAVMQQGLAVSDLTGMVMHPLTRTWRLSADNLKVNYLLSAAKKA